VRLDGDRSGAWFWTESADPSVDFCIWALVGDGLRVPPFDGHPEGSGALRGAGLDAQAWRAWLHAVVGAQEALSRRMGAIADLTALTEPQRRGLEAAFEAAQGPAVWAGAATVRAELDRLWAAYGPIGEAWKRDAERDLRPSRLSGGKQRDRWRRLDAARGELASLSVYVVRYPLPALEVVPPAACVVALGSTPAAGDVYAQSLLRAVRVLGGVVEGRRSV
jgi:hypothetical protein